MDDNILSLEEEKLASVLQEELLGALRSLNLLEKNYNILYSTLHPGIKNLGFLSKLMDKKHLEEYHTLMQWGRKFTAAWNLLIGGRRGETWPYLKLWARELEDILPRINTLLNKFSRGGEDGAALEYLAEVEAAREVLHKIFEDADNILENMSSGEIIHFATHPLLWEEYLEKEDIDNDEEFRRRQIFQTLRELAAEGIDITPELYYEEARANTEPYY